MLQPDIQVQPRFPNPASLSHDLSVTFIRLVPSFLLAIFSSQNGLLVDMHKHPTAHAALSIWLYPKSLKKILSFGCSHTYCQDFVLHKEEGCDKPS